MKIDCEKRVVDTGERKSHLTPKEMAILNYLMSHEGVTVTCEEVYEGVWKSEPFMVEPVIAVHIRHLREKIEPDPSNPSYIRSFWGKGYRFECIS
ncbi:MAG: winged helix-turn-helix domain-containing protein [Solobacterium sp.]|nr:winged helix-turn-helix domain-containing protein [Solobacterium sp.]